MNPRVTRHVSASVIVLLASGGLGGCANFTLDATEQDKHACDYISRVLEGKNWSTIASDGTLEPLALVLEKQALPQASMHFGQQIKSFIDAARKTERESLFAKAAGILQLETYASKIIAHCVKIEMK